MGLHFGAKRNVYLPRTRQYSITYKQATINYVIKFVLFMNIAPILEKLVDEHHIYFCTDGGGRLNVCGLNSRNIDHVAECIHKVVTDT